MKNPYLFLILFLVFALPSHAQYRIELIDSNQCKLGEGVILSKTSFRGLSVVDNQTIWVSGSRGTFAKSTDGGNTFVYTQVKGYEKSDFRDIEAFDDKRAVMMSSGTPAYILKTTDGGQTWKEVYKNTDTAYFLDAMDFWDEQRGIIVGDPIHHHFVLLQTNNGGESWQELDTSKTPLAMEGEAVFAASGTSLRCLGKYGRVGFVTGGKHTRALGKNIASKNGSWEYEHLPIQHGVSSKGAFSFAANDSANLMVGGDYANDKMVSNNSCIQYLPPANKDEVFSQMIDDVKGYRSCVEAISNHQFIACGTSGVDCYANRYWTTISSQGFHVVRKAKKGNAVFLAGPKGKIGRLIR